MRHGEICEAVNPRAEESVDTELRAPKFTFSVTSSKWNSSLKSFENLLNKSGYSLEIFQDPEKRNGVVGPRISPLVAIHGLLGSHTVPLNPCLQLSTGRINISNICDHYIDLLY